MRIAITGATGMVGRNIQERLGQDYQLFAPPRQEVDLLDEQAIIRYFEATRPDLVIHCAGVVGGIQANVREPVKFLVQNADLGIRVIMAAARQGVSRLINIGSSCMYPRAAANPLKEECILTGQLEPTNEGYALAKILSQRLCEYISRENPRLAYKTIIPCNLYGRWDKFDPNNAHMVPSVIRKIHEAKAAGCNRVEIWGSGKARREFMFAGDLADFVAYAIERFAGMPKLLNVGLGYDLSIDEYYDAIARVLGYSGTFVHDSTKPEGMERKLVDISLCARFGWKARTTLEEGIRRTYDFFLQKEMHQ
jgi:GDP-L-fucose synthase